MAREALSARLDGEREPVPSVRVDEHLEQCADCRRWFAAVQTQADALRALADAGPAMAVARGLPGSTRAPRRRVAWSRILLVALGVGQMGIGVVQALGVSVGLAHQHGGGSGHLLNESTAWTLALGVIMVVAGLRPGAAAGLAGVLSAFAVVLSVYVVLDATSGSVSVERVLTHLPILLGAVLAALVWRDSTRTPRAPEPDHGELDIVLPHNASRGRRRGHLWPTDGSAA